MQGFAAFKASLEHHPRLGGVTVGYFDTAPAPPEAAADHCLERFGFTGIGQHWARLGRAEAAGQLSAMLGESLAYGTALMLAAEAAATAETFLAFFPADTVFLTNTTLRRVGDSERGWNPVSASTFDACLVAVGGGTAAFILFEDED